LNAYLDSSAVLDLLDPGSLRHEKAKRTLEKETRTWCVSDLVRLECLVRPLRVKNIEAETEVREILSKMECLPITSSAYDGAASLRAEFGLRTPDAIHLATALTNYCEEFWTNDEKLLRVSTGIVLRTFT
jgi:predicted nucleic acid-binding protein